MGSPRPVNRPESDDTSPPGIWSPHYLPVTASIMTVVAVVSFGGLALVAALSSIADDMGRVGWLPWVITGYLGAAAVAVVVAGPVIDAIGVRRTFRFTGVWFVGSSAVAALAPSMPVLIGARVLQGLGGGLLFAVALAAIGLGYPYEIRARALALQSITWGVIGLGSPALAGLVLAFGGWRAIFGVKILLALLSLVAGWNRLPTTREQPTRIRTDWLGVSLLASVVASSLVGVSQIGVRWWATALALGIAAALVIGYWSYSGKQSEPVLARRHIVRFPLRWIHVTSGLVMLAALGVDNYLPLYVQTTRGRSVEFAAFSLVFVTAGWSLGSIIYSRLLAHRRESDSVVLGAALITPSLVLAGASVALDWSLIVLLVAMTFVGTSVGLVSTSGLALLQASSDEAEMGRVTAAHQFVRQLCVTYGVALAGAILLFVVDLRVGDVEAVRDVIAGEEIALGGETKEAIGAGLAWINMVSAVITVGCLLVAVSLARRTRRRERADSSSLIRSGSSA